MSDDIRAQQANLHTATDGVWFRTSNSHGSQAFVVWDGGDRVAVSIATRHEPDGLGSLITLDDVRLMRTALTEILTRADEDT